MAPPPEMAPTPSQRRPCHTRICHTRIYNIDDTQGLGTEGVGAPRLLTASTTEAGKASARLGLVCHRHCKFLVSQVATAAATVVQVVDAAAAAGAADVVGVVGLVALVDQAASAVERFPWRARALPAAWPAPQSSRRR